MGRSIRIPWLSVFVLTLFSFPLLGGLNEWTTRGPEFPGAITALVTSPLDDATVYASGREGGVFKSVDGGGRWGRASHGLTDWSIRGLAIAPDAPQTLYALTYRSRLFKTEDGAAGWRELSMPNIGTKIAVIALEGGVVLLSTEGGHLVRSTDGGETWTTSMGPCGPATRFKRSADGDVACSGFTPALSEDRGATWQKIETPRRVSLIAFGPDGSVFVFSPEGTHKSVDGGKNFRKVAGLDTAVIKVNDLHVSRSGVVFAGADSGAFALRDEGWKPVEGAALHITAFADLNPASERIYAGTVDGVLTALETDSSWRKASDGLANVFINDVAISPQDPSLLFATGGGARFRSDSATSAWKRLRANVGSFVATSPASPNVVYSGDASIEKSTDAGETWTAIKVSAVSRLAVAQSDPSRLYAALEDQGMARSTDGGETWASIMNNMPWGYYGAIYGFDAYITVDPVDSSVVYVGQEAGLFRTTSGGDSWMPLSQSRAPIAVDPYDPTILYAPFPDSAFSFPRGLSRSNDRGVTWTRIGPVDEEFVDVAVDPSTPGVLYAATERRVYRSVDRGATWSVLGGDLEGPGIRDLEIDASGHYLVAATSGGVFEYEISAVDIAGIAGGADDLAALLDEALAGGAPDAGFVLPIAGVVQGASGLFRTDVTISNERPYAQQVMIAWIPRDGGAMSFFRMTVPAGEMDSPGNGIPNIAGRLGLTGVGTVVAIGVDASGAFDPKAVVSGSARICAYNWDRNPVCETIDAVRAVALAAHPRASASGLRLDAAVRTNVGITNLDGRAHRYVVNAVGERASGTMEIVVPPYALVQRSLPSGDYGALRVEITTDDGSAPWLFFATSIDNATAMATTKIGAP